MALGFKVRAVIESNNNDNTHVSYARKGGRERDLGGNEDVCDRK